MKVSRIERIIEKHQMPKPFEDFYTTPLFWDCECMEDYIHPASETQCLRCGVKREDAPDSRLREVLMNQDVRETQVGSILEELGAELGIIEPIPY